MRERRTEAPLVGRATELARALQLAQDPTTGAVLLTGPTGIGKSRLGEGIMTELGELGWRGVGISGTDSTSRIPYGSLTEILPETLDRLADLDDGTADLTVLRDLETVLALDETPVALAVEDVALLDQRSCDLLVHLAANRRLFIIGSQGPDRGLTEALRRLTPASVVELGVEPLDLAATAELAAALLDGTPGPGLVRNLHARTGGVPLFVRDLIEEARSTGAIELQGDLFQLVGDLVLSPSLGRQIVFRLGVLSEAERDVLELLAIGGEIGVDDLVKLAGPELLEALERRGLIRTWASRRRLRASLGHPLQSDAIRADLTPLVDRRRHRELATLVERHGLRRADDRVLHALACSAAGLPLDSHDLVAAVYTALKHDRVSDAARLATAAFRTEPNEATRTAMAEAMIREGRFVEADALLADSLPDGADDWSRLRRVIRRSSNQLWGFRDADEAARLDRELFDGLTDPDAVRRVEAHVAWIAYCDGRSPEAVAITDSMVEVTHPEVRFAMAVARAPALLLCGRVDDGVDLAQRGWDGGWGADTEFGSHGQHLIAIGYGKLYAGDLETARFIAEEAIAACRRNSEITPLLFFLDLAAWTELLAGELAGAVSYFEEVLHVGAELAIASSARSALAGVTLCQAQLGRADETAAAWHRLHDVPPAPGPRDGLDVDWAEAWTTAVTGDPADGAELLRATAQRAGDQGLVVFQLLVMFDLARLGYATDDDATAARVAGEQCQGRLLPFLAESIDALARSDAAALDDAAAAAGELGLRVWAVELAGRAADAWAVAGDQRAADASERVAERARSQVDDAATPAMARARAVEPLTRREREIAALAARGDGNAAIAEQLHVSVRTVETHLRNAYRKLGINKRSELSDALL